MGLGEDSQLMADCITHRASCVHECQCGRIFYHDDKMYDWEDGELERLKNNPDATNLQLPASIIDSPFGTYARDCNCWHDKMNQFTKMVKNYDRELANFLNRRKQRLIYEANHAPEVKEEGE